VAQYVQALTGVLLQAGAHYLVQVHAVSQPDCPLAGWALGGMVLLLGLGLIAGGVHELYSQATALADPVLAQSLL